jgi:16S rRNA (uracil1498-N3)-methyltransferase
VLFSLDSNSQEIYTFVSYPACGVSVDDLHRLGAQANATKAKQQTKATHSGSAIESAPRGVLIASVDAAFRALSRILNSAVSLNTMTRRRWIADNFTETTASLTGDQAVHLARVLRAEPGQIFDVVANGFLRRATIVNVSEREVTFALGEELESDAALPVHLLLAVIKFDHYEWGIEKLTELGAARITPVLARRTEKHLAQAATKRVRRWRRIAREAAQQSRRSDLPQVDDPLPLQQAVATIATPIRLLLAETEQDNTLTAALQPYASSLEPRPLALAIGPEGGWTADEMQLFADNAWRPITLGPRILRAETAAIAALSICSALL